VAQKEKNQSVHGGKVGFYVLVMECDKQEQLDVDEV
jgi:hypothetical protein